MIYKHFEVVVVPFPFTDRQSLKRRPALVLSQDVSFGELIGHSVLAMITSQKNSPWPLDVPVKDREISGLPAPSVVRMKIFTLDNRLILKKIGCLSPDDQEQVRISLSQLLLI